jgi:hypothetical protein
MPEIKNQAENHVAGQLTALRGRVARELLATRHRTQYVTQFIVASITCYFLSVSTGSRWPERSRPKFAVSPVSPIFEQRKRPCG